MFAIDKAAFGVFLAERRKEKGFTQKELAERLFVSDKAVSKWERGLSLPDVSLLIPLAETLGVTVAELLEGRSLDTDAELDAEQVDKLVKKAITPVRGQSGEEKAKTAQSRADLHRLRRCRSCGNAADPAQRLDGQHTPHPGIDELWFRDIFLVSGQGPAPRLLR